MKKIFAIMLALVLVLAMGIPAMAETPTTGKITIKNAAMGVEYTVVKLFDATVDGNGAINYTGTIPDALATYFEKDSAGNITATAAAKNASGELSENAIAALQTWAATQTGTSQIGAGGSLVFSNLGFGYYVIKSTQGTAITVDSTNPEVEVYDKNVTTPATDLTKTVDDTDVNIGQTVKYTVVFSAPNYDGETQIEKYVIHDTLPNFLSNVTVTSIIVDEDGDFDTTTTDQTNVTAQFSETDKEIELVWVKEDGTSLYQNSAKVRLVYTATVTNNAVTGSAVNGSDGNTNTVTVTWTGDTTGNREDETIYTYSVDIVKTDNQGVLLDGAEFKLYSDAACENEIGLIAEDGDYRPVLTGETAAGSIVVSGGKVTITGLASGTYYLKETKAPDGYNLLATATTITITGENLAASTDVNGETGVEVYDKGGVQVVNQAGSELPSTGGIGTTIFYVVGGLLMAAAIVLLVTKKKVSSK